jgi:GNAT superfamily N-acetyltransferase
MIRRVGADEVEARYLEGLNACFPGWGGPSMYDWCFRRAVGGPPADLFVAEEAGRLIAGSATTYRIARRPGRAPEPIGCMTATWTLRAARGRGLFERLIEESRLQARRRGCRLLTAFAGTGKASRPGLLAAGAEAVEGAFLTSPAAEEQAGRREEAPPTMAETVAAFAGRRLAPGLSRLDYASEAWRGQMLDRPHSVERRRLTGGAVALIERAGEVDRLLDVSTGAGDDFVAAVLEAAEVSAPHGRRLSAYSLDRGVIDALAGRGFAVTRAWLYLMAAAGELDAEERWWFANGDRM